MQRNQLQTSMAVDDLAPFVISMVGSGNPFYFRRGASGVHWTMSPAEATEFKSYDEARSVIDTDLALYRCQVAVAV